jgi:hypothetical protein
MPENLDINQIIHRQCRRSLAIRASTCKKIQRLPCLFLKPEPPDNKADQHNTKAINQHLIHAVLPL